jgi:hypothetical protein
MAHMPAFKQPPASQAGPKDLEDKFRELWWAMPWPASQQPLKAPEPEQRGFIIGGVRL